MKFQVFGGFTPFFWEYIGSIEDELWQIRYTEETKFTSALGGNNRLEETIECDNFTCKIPLKRS